MTYLKKIEAKLRLQLEDEDLDKMGLIRVSEDKVVPFADFWKEKNVSIQSSALRDVLQKKPSLKLPEGLEVRGSLDLRGTKVTALPPGLEIIGGSLDLFRTKIKALPPGLRVDGRLDLRGTQIKNLPDDLQVGGSIWVTENKAFDSGKFKDKVTIWY